MRYLFLLALLSGCEPTCHNRCTEFYEEISTTGHSWVNQGVEVSFMDVCTDKHNVMFADIQDCGPCQEALLAVERLDIVMCE